MRSHDIGMWLDVRGGKLLGPVSRVDDSIIVPRQVIMEGSELATPAVVFRSLVVYCLKQKKIDV